MALPDKLKTIILSNQVECLLCGDKPFSSTRHDFKYCKCGAVAVDGGCDYLRRVFREGKPEGTYRDISIEWPDAEYHAAREALQNLVGASPEFQWAKAYRNLRGLPAELTEPLLSAAEWCKASRRNVHGVVCAMARVERDGKWVE